MPMISIARPFRSSVANSAFSKVKRSSMGFSHGLKLGMNGSLLGVPFIAFEAGAAQRGERLPTMASSAIALATYPIMTGVIAGALAATGIGAPVAAFMSLFLASYPNSELEAGLNRGFKKFTKLSQHIHRLEMGGDYTDTETAYNQRLLAVRDMSGSFQSARRYLGQEARFFRS
jgi:hypothetical protein